MQQAKDAAIRPARLDIGLNGDDTSVGMHAQFQRLEQELEGEGGMGDLRSVCKTLNQKNAELASELRTLKSSDGRTALVVRPHKRPGDLLASPGKRQHMDERVYGLQHDNRAQVQSSTGMGNHPLPGAQRHDMGPPHPYREERGLLPSRGLIPLVASAQSGEPASEIALNPGQGQFKVPALGSYSMPGSTLESAQSRGSASEMTLNPGRQQSKVPALGSYPIPGLTWETWQALGKTLMPPKSGNTGAGMGSGISDPRLKQVQSMTERDAQFLTPGRSQNVPCRVSSRAPASAINMPRPAIPVGLAEEARLPLVLWVPDDSEDGGAWRNEDDMPEDLRVFLRNGLYSKICDENKVGKWGSLREGNEEVCVLSWCIGRATSVEWTGQKAKSACKTCTASLAIRGRGRPPVSRPCGRMLRGEVGILPLPERERVGKSWEDKGFWVNRAD
jgi:hypothetical protein